MFSEIATEHMVKTFVEEIKKNLEANKDNPDAIVALKQLGQFALNHFGGDTPEWVKDYQALFGISVPDNNPLLDMKVEDFFKSERLLELGVPSFIAVRAVKAARSMQYWDPRADSRRAAGIDLKNMREFLVLYETRYPFTRVPNCGKKSVDALMLAIKSAGLPIKDSK